LHPPHEAGVHQAQQHPGPEDRRHADDDLSATGVGPDQVGGDDHAEADHRPDGQIEVADEDGVGLADGRHRQRHRQQQDVVDVRGVEEPLEPRVRVDQEPGDEEDLERHRHPQPEPDHLPPLVLVPGVAEDLADELAGGIDPGGGDRLDHADPSPDAPLDDDGALGIAAPSGERADRDMPGPRTMASTMRTSSSSSPGISSTIVPRDMTRTRSQRPDSSIGSEDLTRMAAPASARLRNAEKISKRAPMSTHWVGS